MSVCWICGASGPLTGEHRAKKSDLRAVFGNVGPSAPLYWHDSKGRQNVPIRSLNADRLKVSDQLCADCNNRRTQPHDRAWEDLSEALRSRLSSSPSARRFHARTVFPYNTKQQLLNVHLYFAKLFGCFISEDSIPLDLASLATAIMQGRSHPKLYLKFGLGPFFRGERWSGRDHINVAAGGPYFASFLYCMRPIAVQVLLTEEAIAHNIDAWHPRLGTTKLKLVDYAELLTGAAALQAVAKMTRS